MNAKTIATALFALAALSSGAQAQEATFEAAPQWTIGRTATAAAPVAGKTREQVRAELEQARKDGSIKAWSAGYIEPLKSVKTRAEVLAELNDARRHRHGSCITIRAVGVQASACENSCHSFRLARQERLLHAGTAHGSARAPRDRASRRGPALPEPASCPSRPCVRSG